VLAGRRSPPMPSYIQYSTAVYSIYMVRGEGVTRQRPFRGNAAKPKSRIFGSYLCAGRSSLPSCIIYTVQYSCVQYIYGTRGGCDPPAAFPRKCRKTQVPNIRELFVCLQVVAPLTSYIQYSTAVYSIYMVRGEGVTRQRPFRGNAVKPNSRIFGTSQAIYLLSLEFPESHRLAII
jgi:hypothetical protein